MRKIIAFKTVADVTLFASVLGNALQDSGHDFATLGHTKRLHAIAKGMGYDNWQQYSAILTKQEFMNTMATEYGLGEAYSDAAWFTLSDRSRPGAEMARHYCARFNIKPEKAPETILSEDVTKLCKWLNDNSSGTYRPSAQAAELIQDLMSMLTNDRRMYADQCFEEFDFDAEVKDAEGWENTHIDYWTCNVFLENNADEDSVKQKFFVEFSPKSSIVKSHGILGLG